MAHPIAEDVRALWRLGERRGHALVIVRLFVQVKRASTSFRLCFFVLFFCSQLEKWLASMSERAKSPPSLRSVVRAFFHPGGACPRDAAAQVESATLHVSDLFFRVWFFFPPYRSRMR